MSFVGRPRATIRDTLLANWRARYLAAGRDLDVNEGSHAWMMADVVALELEGIEAAAEARTLEIFPDTAAASATVTRHATLVGLERKAAVATVLTTTFSGVVGSAWTVTDTLTGTNGVTYAPTAAGVIPPAGFVTQAVRALEAGTVGNLPDLSTLTFNAAPAGLDPFAVVASTATAGAAAETDAALAARTLDWWRERPGSGNRSDWEAWCESVAGVERAYVYPLYSPTLGAGTLGCVTVVLLGPAPDLVVGAGVVTEVGDLVHGTGSYASAGPLRPVTQAAGDVTIQAAVPATQAVTVRLLALSGFSFPFAGAYTIAVVNADDSIDLNAGAGGDMAIGDGIAIVVPAAAGVRGNVHVTTIKTVTPGNVTVTIDDPFPNYSTSPPVVGAAVLPAPGNWIACRDAILAVFDNLGPGDTSPATRFPDEGTEGPATLYVSAVFAAVMGTPGLPGAPARVSGVRNASVTTPAADVPAAAFGLVTPGTITFTP